MAHVSRIHVSGRIAPGPFSLTGEAAKRLISVMRVQPGEPVLLFSGDGSEWQASVASVARDRLVLQVSGQARRSVPPTVGLEVWAAMVRPQRFDWLIEKCTEAGVDVIRPLTSQYSARGETASASRAERWNRIAIEASEQCGRLSLPVIGPLAAFADLLEPHGHPVFIAQPGGQSIFELEPLLPVRGTAIIAIGPEGGFSEDEVRTARSRGALSLSLGSNILRTETAALAATMLLRMALDHQG